jgi:hypothetical protein
MMTPQGSAPWVAAGVARSLGGPDSRIVSNEHLDEGLEMPFFKAKQLRGGSFWHPVGCLMAVIRL